MHFRHFEADLSCLRARFVVHNAVYDLLEIYGYRNRRPTPLLSPCCRSFLIDLLIDFAGFIVSSIKAVHSRSRTQKLAIASPVSLSTILHTCPAKIKHATSFYLEISVYEKSQE